MIRLEPTLDFERVRSVMTNPKLYPHIADDFYPPPEQFHPNEHPSITYLLAFDCAEASGAELLGLFITYPINRLLWQVDQCFLPNAWGRRTREAGKAFLAWLWDNTPALKVFGFTPSKNSLAVRYAKSLGLRELGRLDGCFLRKGELQDLIICGRSRPKTR